MDVTERNRQHAAYHAEARRKCGVECEFQLIGTTPTVVTLQPLIPDPKLCPVRIRSSLEAYVRGLPPGDFIRSVLSNDLSEAIARADDENIHALPHIVAYVREHLPAISWGSPAHVNHWLRVKADQRREKLERES